MPHGDLARRMLANDSELPPPLPWETATDSSGFSSPEDAGRLETNTESLVRAGKEVIDVREEEEIQEFLAHDPIVQEAVKKFETLYEALSPLMEQFPHEPDASKRDILQEHIDVFLGSPEHAGLIELVEKDIKIAEEGARQLFLLKKEEKNLQELLERIQAHGRELAEIKDRLGPEKVPVAEAVALLDDKKIAAVAAGDVAARKEITVRLNMRPTPVSELSIEPPREASAKRPATWGRDNTDVTSSRTLEATRQLNMPRFGDQEVDLSDDDIEELDNTPLTPEELQQVSVDVRMSALDNERENIRAMVIPEDKQKDIYFLRSLQRQAGDIMNRAKLVHGDNIPVADQQKIVDTQSELFSTLDRRMATFGTLLNSVSYEEGQHQLEEADTDLRTTERRLYLARLGKLAGITRGQVNQLKIDLFRAQAKYADVLDFVSKLTPEQQETTPSSSPMKVEAPVRPVSSSQNRGMLGTAALGIGLLGAKLAGLFGGGAQEVKKKPEPPAAIKSAESIQAQASLSTAERAETIAKQVVPPENLPIGTPDLRPRVNTDNLMRKIEEDVPIVEAAAENAAPKSEAPNFIVPIPVKEVRAGRQSDVIAEAVTVVKTAEGKELKIKPAVLQSKNNLDKRNFGILIEPGKRKNEVTAKSVEKTSNKTLPTFEKVFEDLLASSGVDIMPYLERFERPPQKAIDTLSNLSVETLRGLLTQAENDVKRLRVTAEPDTSQLGQKRTLVETLRAALKLSLKDDAPPKAAKERKTSKLKEVKAEKMVSPEIALKGNLSKVKSAVLEARRDFLNKEIVRLNDSMAQATFEAQQKGGALADVAIPELDRTALLEANMELVDINSELNRRVVVPQEKITIDDMRAARDDAKNSFGEDSPEYKKAAEAYTKFVIDNNIVEEARVPENMVKPKIEINPLEKKFTDFDNIQQARTAAKKQFGVDSDEYKAADAAYKAYMKDNGWRAD